MWRPSLYGHDPPTVCGRRLTLFALRAPEEIFIFSRIFLKRNVLGLKCQSGWRFAFRDRFYCMRFWSGRTEKMKMFRNTTCCRNLNLTSWQTSTTGTVIPRSSVGGVREALLLRIFGEDMCSCPSALDTWWLDVGTWRWHVM